MVFGRSNKTESQNSDCTTKTMDIGVQDGSIERSLEDAGELFFFGLQNFRHELAFRTQVNLGLKDRLDAKAEAMVQELFSQLHSISAENIYQETGEKLKHMPTDTHREIIERGFEDYMKSLNTQAKSIICQYRSPLANCEASVSGDEYKAYRATLLERNEPCALELNLPRFNR